MKRGLIAIAIAVLVFSNVACAQDLGGLWRLSGGVFSNKVPATTVYIRMASGDSVAIGTFIDFRAFDSTRVSVLVVGNQAFPATLGANGQVLKSDGSTIVWGSDLEGAGPISYYSVSSRDSLYAMSGISGFTDSLQFMLATKQINAFDGVTTRYGTVMQTFNHTLDLSSNKVKFDTIWYNHLTPITNTSDPAYITVDEVTAKQGNMTLRTPNTYDVRVGLNRDNGFSIYGTPGGTTERWAFQDSTLTTINGVITGIAKQQFAGAVGSGYIVLNGDSLNDWTDIIPDTATKAGTAGVAQDVDTDLMPDLKAWLNGQGLSTNADSINGHAFTLLLPEDNSLMRYDEDLETYVKLPFEDLVTWLNDTITGSGGGFWDTVSVNVAQLVVDDDTLLVVTDAGDTSIVSSGENNVLRLGSGGSGPFQVVGRSSIFEDVETDADGIEDSSLNWPVSYLTVSDWAGQGHYTEDSVELIGPMFTTTAGGYVNDITVGSTGGADTIMAIITIPFNCTLDSLIFTVDVTDATLAALSLDGPARTSFVNRIDSTYYSSSTGWNPTTPTRYSLALTSKPAFAGEVFAVKFYNTFPGTGDAVRLGPVQLAVQR